MLIGQDSQPSHVHLLHTYTQVRDPVKNKVYVIGESRLSFMPGAVPKASKKKKEGDEKPQQVCVCVFVCL